MGTLSKDNFSVNGTKYPVPITEMRERYLQLFSGAINDVLRFNYKMHATSLPASYRPLREEMKMVGQAFTIKGGPDITTDGEFELRAEMLEALHEDSVVIWDCTGDTVTSQWGEVMTMAARKAGCRGALINGIRDTQSILDQGFPVFYQYKSNTGMLGRFRMYYYQKPVLIGEIIIKPGDWIFGDIDGVIAIPAAIAYDVLVAAEAIKVKEVDIKAMVESGLKPTEVVKRGGYF
ncbi:RraA family protein [Parapedobacter indicus]|uniref:Putative 4-hydroxy-4-methyl-2-oxoglutarate aldolase n=1 Tax=Parapedobacter indicus TaxID=1477437 RepID=A0A1I3HIE1_9SPHI|nr:RraA family protein [Parapedobacter indicus]PPL03049.1 regulator of RNase E activity RraA [Parapedobacter indicus]SFI35403.1 Regulator of RNase E activity RraA [Parapedobacter indicus]